MMKFFDVHFCRETIGGGWLGCHIGDVVEFSVVVEHKLNGLSPFMEVLAIEFLHCELKGQESFGLAIAGLSGHLVVV